MNYFEFYPGDYLRDTTRLSMQEDGAYLRLLMAYYSEERPLPADFDELFQIARAISASDKAAVRKVADRYFPIGEDGLRHKARVDDEIAKAQKRIQVARENGKKHKPKNPAGMPAAIPAGTQRVTHSGEALHTPHATLSVELPTHTGSSSSGPTLAGRACRLMREAGCVQTNPSNLELLAALDEGITPETLADFARNATGKRSPFAYAISAARGAHAAGAAPVVTGQPRTRSPSNGNTSIAVILGASHAQHPGSAVVLDVDPRGAGEPALPEPRRLSRG